MFQYFTQQAIITYGHFPLKGIPVSNNKIVGHVDLTVKSLNDGFNVVQIVASCWYRFSCSCITEHKIYFNKCRDDVYKLNISSKCRILNIQRQLTYNLCVNACK